MSANDKLLETDGKLDDKALVEAIKYWSSFEAQYRAYEPWVVTQAIKVYLDHAMHNGRSIWMGVAVLELITILWLVL